MTGRPTAATVPPRPTLEALGSLRHELRAAAYLLISYCERLLDDATVSGHASRHRPLGQALVAAHQILMFVNKALPASKTDVSHEDIAGLNASLREPQQEIVGAMATLLEVSETSADAHFASDVRTIQSTTLQLLAADTVCLTPTPMPTVAPFVTRQEEPRPTRHPNADGAEEARHRILVADDSPDIRRSLKSHLKRQGHVVECAENGSEALEMAATNSYDLVLSDIQMPELDGFELLERLKAAPATRHIPVIMISGVDDVSSVVRCIEHGAEDHLPKPFEAALLRARVTACLEKKRMRDREIDYLLRVRDVIDAAKAVEADAYEPQSLTGVIGRKDELGQLARVFDGMVAKVRARQERLEGQVRDLKRQVRKTRELRRPSGAVTTDPSLPTGEIFAGRYEVLEELGRGGMGLVYKAHDQELNEDVAIKTVRGELLSIDPTLIDRFKSETRLARRISHHNVVRTHDFGEWDDIYYLTMEFVEGVTLRELLDTEGHLGVSSALAIGTQLLDALAVAHEQGVIHRDIKPHNLLLDDEGVLKVMDFGVARPTEPSVHLTVAGAMVGTPTYMAPEQLFGQDVDTRSDLYSAGVVLYECLTGQLPFDALTPLALAAKVLDEEADSPATKNPDVSAVLSNLVMTLISKHADDRPSSAADTARQLRQME